MEGGDLGVAMNDGVRKRETDLGVDPFDLLGKVTA